MQRPCRASDARTVLFSRLLPLGTDGVIRESRLEMSPLEFGTPSPVSFSQLIKPVGTTYTFTVTVDEAAPTLITFDLHAARPFVRPRPDGKPEIGDTVVTTQFEALPAPELTLVSRGEHDALKLE